MPSVPETEPTPLNIAQQELPENALLDVGVHVLEPGPISDKDKERGITEEVRNAEGHFAAVHLKNTIQRSGQWGAVRVLPGETEAAEVEVRGQIKESDGQSLAVQIEVLDATGRKWFSKRYQQKVTSQAYTEAQDGEVFQDLYNRIANDLYLEKSRLDADQLEQIHRVAQLRYAGSLAPEAFGDYLAAEDGKYRVRRLPANDDPMLARVLQIREREYLMVDVINGYYDNLYAEMSKPYADWRRTSAEEAAALADLKRKSTKRYLLGSALILGAIAVEMLGGSDVNTGTLRDVMVVGGAATVKSGMDLGAQKRIHEDALRELGQSFQAEVSPMVVDVEGQTTELTGSAEEQFTQWRQLLRQIYHSETGLPVPMIRVEEPAVPADASPTESDGPQPTAPVDASPSESDGPQPAAPADASPSESDGPQPTKPEKGSAPSTVVDDLPDQT